MWPSVSVAAPLLLLSMAAAAAPVFVPAERAVSNWRDEAAANLAPASAAALREAPTAAVARCIKLNNYWCIKKAGWLGELASDGEGHVAFASAREGAAVAALLLRRYYVDFHRRSALAIVSRWAPPGCGGGIVASGGSLGTLTAIAGTLRARWLAGHGGAPTAAARTSRRSRVPDHVPGLAAPASIIAGADAPSPDAPRPGAPRPAARGHAMTLDALMASTPGMPPSRSMIGMGRPTGRSAPRPTERTGERSGDPLGDTGAACPGDAARIAAYAARAAAGIAAAPGDDLVLFGPDGAATGNLARLMRNMAAVEIGPAEPAPALIEAGIADAFRPGRNPGR